MGSRFLAQAIAENRPKDFLRVEAAEDYRASANQRLPLRPTSLPRLLVACLSLRPKCQNPQLLRRMSLGNSEIGPQVRCWDWLRCEALQGLPNLVTERPHRPASL